MRYLYLFALLFILASCGEEKSVSNDDENVILKKTINVQNEAASIRIENQLTVNLPIGLHDKDFDIIISKVDNLPFHQNSKIPLRYFDVKLSFGSQFSKNINIKMDLDPAWFNNNLGANQYSFEYYDEIDKKYKDFENYNININENYIECYTNHLTKIVVFQEYDSLYSKNTIK